MLEKLLFFIFFIFFSCFSPFFTFLFHSIQNIFLFFLKKLIFFFPQNFFTIKFQIYASFIINEFGFLKSGISRRTTNQNCICSFCSFCASYGICAFSYLNFYKDKITFFLCMYRFTAFRSVSATFLFLSIFGSGSWTTSSFSFL